MTRSIVVRQQEVPLLAALVLSQVSISLPRFRPPLEPALKAERTALLTEMRAAAGGDPRKIDAGAIPTGGLSPGETEVSYVARPGEFVSRRYPWNESAATPITDLLAALEADFLKRPNAMQARCGFHADVTLQTRYARPLTVGLCFGCGIVRVEVPVATTDAGQSRNPRQPATSGSQAGSPSFVYWMMVDDRALRRAVLAALPEIQLPKERDEEALRASVDSCR